MKNISWDIEEAVALYALYFNNYVTGSITDECYMNLSDKLNRRAKILGLNVSNTFRNLNGLKMQIQCIHHVVTDGNEGLANTSKLFYDVYEMYKNNHQQFCSILNDFNLKYS